MTDGEPITKAETARRLARCGWSNAEISALIGLRPRSVRQAVQEGVRAGQIQPNGERRGEGAINAPGVRR